MDLLSAAISHYDSIVKKSAFDINVCIKNQISQNAFEDFIAAVRKYDSARSQLEIVQNLQTQLESINNENKTDVNNN
jgi:hypothetical protein